jgi:predicted dinucleotide-utilizing enzyme
MSVLSVTTITTGDASTPLTFQTGNTNGGSIKVESGNDDVIFSGTARITGPIFAAGVNVSQTFTVANLAFNTANSKTSNARSVAISILFG